MCVALCIVRHAVHKLGVLKICLWSTDGKRACFVSFGAQQNFVSKHKRDDAGRFGIHYALTCHQVAL